MVASHYASMAALVQAEEAYQGRKERLRQQFLASSSAWEASMMLRRMEKRKNWQRRRFWVRAGRTSLWWDNIRDGISCEEEYKENFRMKENFQKLCDELRPHLYWKNTVMQKAVDVETQIALTLYYLSDEGRLRKTANAFVL